MKTIQVNLFTISELSDEARERALNDYRSKYFEFAWSSEYLESLKRGLEALNCKLVNYNIDWLDYNRSDVSISTYSYIDSDVEQLTGQRLRTYILNNFYDVLYCGKPYGEYKKRNGDKWAYKRHSNVQYIETSCPFTGFCSDDDFLQPLRDFLKNPCNYTTLEELVKECVDAVILSGCKDAEYQYSDEGIKEHIEANDYTFLESGKMYY